VIRSDHAALPANDDALRANDAALPANDDTLRSTP
jgi:hypothetical protein